MLFISRPVIRHFTHLTPYDSSFHALQCIISGPEMAKNSEQGKRTFPRSTRLEVGSTACCSSRATISRKALPRSVCVCVSARERGRERKRNGDRDYECCSSRATTSRKDSPRSVRERVRERERETDRQTVKTERQAGRERERERESESEIEREKGLLCARTRRGPESSEGGTILNGLRTLIDSGLGHKTRRC